jgi:hypothetical protein
MPATARGAVHQPPRKVTIAVIRHSRRAAGRRFHGTGMKIVYRAENIIDANLVKGALEIEGITAFVSGEYLTGAAGELPCWNLVAVMVADHDVERAAPIAGRIDLALREQRAQNDGLAGEALPA